MESLLPSEIARLVLGYLEEQKCDDAARMFLGTSPHLQECRIVTSTGRRFSTKVNGFTLVDILEKFCAANAIIHERLSKVSDCEQLKHCGDLLEQLRFLVDGSRGQRFVVNINVPTTSQVSGGSPIISSSMRKRHHSGSDRERSKRSQKSLSQPLGQSSEPVTSQLSCNAVETTPLEHLPGHSGSEKVEIPVEEIAEKCQEIPTTSNCSSTVPEATGLRSTPENSRGFMKSLESHSKPNYEASPQKDGQNQEKCSTATDTEELMQYTNSEVQTNPYDVAESETESAYEPVENLSLLTKELLNRTELQERIAENINKAILPSDSSMRDVSLNESVGGEMNTSIMTELNNAIKSVVTATESDPLFAQFLDDIIGPNAGNDESPDETNDHQPARPNEEPIKPADSTSRDARPEAPVLFDKLAVAKSPTIDVPLKNRLRSSSSQQTVRTEEDGGNAEKAIPKDDVAALEDVNAAAVLSIINANSKTEDDKSANISTSDTLSTNAENATVAPAEVNKVQETNRPNSAKTVEPEKATAAAPAATSVDAKSTKKTNVRKPRVAKPRANTVAQPSLISEEDIMAMPTLIVCSKEEMSTIINTAPIITEPVGPGGYCASQFLPIAPKIGDVPPKPEPIYLRTVTVPTKISDIPKIFDDQNLQTVKAWQEMNVIEESKLRSDESTDKTVQNVPTSAVTTEVKVPEKITLYGNENSAVTMLENSLVSTLPVTEPISVTGTSLSPFLKFNNDRPKPVEPPVTASQTQENEAAQIATTSNDDNYDYITKRTPRSLLKSRSKNNRLSLSTPRRRSSHIRALDFNTPSKSIASARRSSTNESFDYSPKSAGFEKKVCRASLFKSPPFASGQSPKKIKSPLKERSLCKVPIATRSPAPKLMGGWEKYTGVGMILGSTSPSSSNGSPDKTTTTTVTSQKSVKNWDTDLRKSLMPSDNTDVISKPKKTVTRKSTQVVKRQGKKRTAQNTGKVEIGGVPKDPGPKEKQLNSDPPAVEPCPAAEGSENDQPSRVTSKSNLQPTLGKETAKSSNVSVASKITEVAANLPIIMDTPPISKDAVVKTTKKKYATLKTITTSITKIATEITANSIVENIGEYSCTEKSKVIQLPDMLELETPRKFESNIGIPPTPRLLSPGSSNMTTPFGQLGDDASRVRGFVSTPEFPPTPSINLTPKQSSADGSEKKEEFQACSEYYEPSSRPKDPRTIRINDHSRHDMSLPLPGMMMAIAAESRVKDISVEVGRGFQATTTNNRLEITQFEVIKENLPREEAFRELKISVDTSDVGKNEDTSCPEIANVSCISLEADVPDTKDLNNTSSTIDYSSDSDTSSSSDSSTSSSSSSSSSSTTNTSPNLTRDKSNEPANEIHSDTSNDSSRKSANAESIGVPILEDPATNVGTIDTSAILETSGNEISPSKVFPIVKTDEELAASEALETPAKEDCVLPEAVISETPSSSKAAIETTNLSSKISAFITAEDREKECDDNSTKKALPKVISVQRILPNVSMAMKPPLVSDNPLNATQCKNQSKVLSDAKLSRQLEEKRLRLMAKLKEKPKSTIHRPRVKRAVVIARSKKQADDNQEHQEPVNTEVKEKDEIAEVDDTKTHLGTDEPAWEIEERKQTKDQMIEEEIFAPKECPQEEEKVAGKKSFDDDGKKITLNPSSKDETEKTVDKNSSMEKKKLSVKKSMDEWEETAKKKSPDEDRETKEGTHKKHQKKQKEQTNKEISEFPSENKSFEDETQDVKSEEEATKRGESARNDREKSDDATEQKSAKSRRSRSIDKAVITTESELGKSGRIQELHQETSGRSNVIDFLSCQEKPAQSVDNPKKEKKEIKESIPVSIDANRITTKSKVDLVKRDLFSDEESNDQRTTRSRTRQTTDLPINESSDSRSSPSRLSEKNISSSCAAAAAEDMPGVLECLDLVPTVKGDTTDEAGNAILDHSHTQRHHGEYHFIYDESVPTKKRKRKFSNSELEFPVEVELSDENYRKCPKLMTATSFEEIFNLTPPRKKRGTKESTQCKNKKEITAKKVKPAFKGIQEKPLATSSPFFKTATSKISGKTQKTPKKTEHESVDPKKITLRNDTKQLEREHDKGNVKTRKRKGSISKDSEQVDKKSKLTNPQLLLNKLDLDKFLTTVHGPA